MEVTFADRRLERAYLESRLAIRQWGDVVGRRFVQRIDVLKATNRFEDLFELRALRVHPLKGEHAGKHALTIHGRWRLIVRASDRQVEVLEATNHYGD
jgi:plasmid maintenance system killer protein